MFWECFNFFDSEFQVLIIDGDNKPINITRNIYTDTIATQFNWKFPDNFLEEIKEKVDFRYLYEKSILHLKLRES